ncbi:PAS domain-containing sensor histidine kinase [Aquimarina sp. AD10]|uniref:PAS domain-containing sensor histidine kinase n=1 Tax=Aquimarina sp. AD10 TaxID=1714849 RepID=UPI000E4D6DB2|nr:PAS domain-containing sensor histidine kinase [Aquimarina sp. AD10]AXT62997.1 PAS domain-containing sensor histidine kinase [Aquimarina sp. AD10]RKM92103.1 PAS domain S-box protein [Aquimarina sp. AD10]
MKVFEKNNNIFRLLSEAISEAIVVVNNEQFIVANNGSANEIFGYEEDELVGKPLNILIPKEYHHSHDGHFDRFTKHKSKRHMGAGQDLFGIRKDGTIFPVEAGLNPFTIYGSNYVMALITDITIRKQQQQQITELNSQLERKIELRTEELHSTIEELKEEVKLRKEAEAKTKESLKKEQDLNELKTKFLSLVSHEFKTPLSGILTSATLIGKYTQEDQQSKREKHLGTIKNKVKYLDTILNDFLSIERLETGKVSYKFSSFPLSKVINEVIYNANMLLKDGQRINYPQDVDDYTIDFDEKILELILSNLIHNAVKYSGEHSVIDLQVKLEEKTLVFKIIDQGIGIPEKEQQFIFKRYFRAENALLDQGTGIGLNIVKSHIENLGGSITFTSQENKGSTFILKIPVTNNDQSV